MCTDLVDDLIAVSCNRFGRCNCTSETCREPCESPEDYQCMRCPQGEYNFLPGGPCITCPPGGAVCYGGGYGNSGVAAKYGYYGFVQDSGDGLSMFHCPEDQCCRHKHCLVNGTAECAPTRDPQTPLCGACEGTKSETLGSTQCKQCNETNWILITVQVLLYCCIGCYLYHGAKKAEDAEDVPVVQIILIKNITYYYQVVSLGSLSIDLACLSRLCHCCWTLVR